MAIPFSAFFSTLLGDVIVAERVYSFKYGKVKRVANGKGSELRLDRDLTTYSPAEQLKFLLEEQAGPLKVVPPSTPPVPLVQLARNLLEALQRGPDPNAIKSLPDGAKTLAYARAHGWIHPKKLAVTAGGRLHLEQWLTGALSGSPSRPTVRIGAIASSEQVQEDPQLFPMLKPIVRKTLGVEMEGASIGYAGAAERVETIIAKGVMDHGDHDKDDRFQQYASEASAWFMLDFVRRVWSSEWRTRPDKATELARAGTEQRKQELERVKSAIDADFKGLEDFRPFWGNDIPREDVLGPEARKRFAEADQALAVFDKRGFIESEGMADYFVKIGDFWVAQGQLVNAHSRYERALELDGSNALALGALGRLLSYVAHELAHPVARDILLAQAEQRLSRAVQNGQSGNALIMHDLAWVLDERREYFRAAATYREARKLLTVRDDALLGPISYNLACTLACAGSLEEALAELEMALQYGDFRNQASTDSDLEALRSGPWAERFSQLLKARV